MGDRPGQELGRKGEGLMLAHIVSGIVIIVLLILSWQDFKDKLISLILIIALGLLSTAYSYLVSGIEMLIESTLTNLGLIAITSCIIYLYFKYRKKSGLSELKKSIGLGDVLFVVCLTFLFSPFNFIIFNIVGFGAGLLQ